MIDGSEFQDLIAETGLSRRQVAERLETSHTNINKKCHADEVSALYEYAVRWIIREQEAVTESGSGEGA